LYSIHLSSCFTTFHCSSHLYCTIWPCPLITPHSHFTKSSSPVSIHLKPLLASLAGQHCLFGRKATCLNKCASLITVYSQQTIFCGLNTGSRSHFVDEYRKQTFVDAIQEADHILWMNTGSRHLWTQYRKQITFCGRNVYTTWGCLSPLHPTSLHPLIPPYPLTPPHPLTLPHSLTPPYPLDLHTLEEVVTHIKSYPSIA